MACLCKECIHRIAGRCYKRSMEINEKFIKAWGCGDYECRYEELFKEEIKKYDKSRTRKTNI